MTPTRAISADDHEHRRPRPEHAYCVKVLTYAVSYDGPLSEKALRDYALRTVRDEFDACGLEIVKLDADGRPMP